MKKTVLLLTGLLLSGMGAQAQWLLQPASFRFDATPAYIDAVDANVAWAADYDYLEGYGDRQVARTINGGATWTVSTIPNLVDGQEITGIAALSATTAVISVLDGNQGGGSLLKTTDGGATWTVRTTVGQFDNESSYPDLVTFFNATEGVAVGDPLPGNNSFEIYTTADAGSTWTRVPDAGLPAALPSEYGALGILGGLLPPAVVGNSIRFISTEGRVFSSINKGLTWTVSTPGLPEIQSIAFRDVNNGLAMAIDQTGGPNHTLARTTDGGASWQVVNYTGPMHAIALDNVPGTSQFISVGIDLMNNDAGSSYSRDNGQTWVSIETTRSHASIDVASPTAAWSGAINDATGTGLGFYKLTSTVLSSTKDVVLQRGLSVFPNPSADGQFTVKLASGLSSEAQVTVFDALGRAVYSRAAKAATPSLALDLSRQAAGVYTLQLQTASGTAQQKLVIQ
jgi:photosystem II stability/assembly factor-like uncharacterized protein